MISAAVSYFIGQKTGSAWKQISSKKKEISINIFFEFKKFLFFELIFLSKGNIFLIFQSLVRAFFYLGGFRSPQSPLPLSQVPPPPAPKLSQIQLGKSNMS